METSSIALIASLVGATAGFFLQPIISKKLHISKTYRIEVEGKPAVDVPVAQDLRSLKERIAALESVSPRLAVLDGWQLVSLAIVEQAKGVKGIGDALSQNAIQLAAELPGMTPQLLASIDNLKQSRNMVAHSAAKVDEENLKQSVRSIIAILSKIAPMYRPESDVEPAS